MKAILMLEDGRTFYGQTLNNSADAIGETIINTAVVGYQEMMTDPAGAGKILVLTYPLIGNYGIAPKFNESKKVWLSGLVIREKSRIFSNWQAKSSFDDFVKKNKLPVICEVDTRTLAVHLRHKGQICAIISSKCFEPTELLIKLKNFNKEKASFLSKISVNKLKKIGKKKSKYRIAVLDLGITNSILRQLETLGPSLILLPYKTEAKQILRLRPNGLIISNGPEDDPNLEDVINSLKPLINRLPILGISTGCQVLAAALGAEITRLKLGHHGVNYPVQNPLAYKAEITVQNHTRVVDADSLSRIKNIKITSFNLNDRSVEEFESKRLRLIGAQYIPASPGFKEVNNVFRRFVKML